MLLPLGGLLVAAFVGWTWSRSDAFRIAGLEHNWIGRSWSFLVKFFASVSIAAILLGMAAA